MNACRRNINIYAPALPGIKLGAIKRALCSHFRLKKTFYMGGYVCFPLLDAALAATWPLLVPSGIFRPALVAYIDEWHRPEKLGSVYNIASLDGPLLFFHQLYPMHCALRFIPFFFPLITAICGIIIIFPCRHLLTSAFALGGFALGILGLCSFRILFTLISNFVWPFKTRRWLARKRNRWCQSSVKYDNQNIKDELHRSQN